MPVTIKDVAQQLEISVTTVSRAIAGYSDVAESTRQLVLQTAKDMGYVPRHAARNLRLQRTNTIGLIFPTSGGRFSDPFFSEFLAGIGDEATEQEYDLLVSVASRGEAEEQAYLRWARSRRVDGFVLVRMRINDWRSRYLHNEGIPFVSFGPHHIENGHPWIGVNGQVGMIKLVNHLTSQGHHRIAFIGAPEYLYFVSNRFSGYCKGLEKAGLSFSSELVCEADLTQRGGYQAAQFLFKMSSPPTAIIGVNDLTALGAMRAAQEQNLHVGIDLAIAGFDGTEAGEHSHPSLTTVAQPVYAIGRQVSQLLVNLLNGDKVEPGGSIIHPELIVRASTDFQVR